MVSISQRLVQDLEKADEEDSIRVKKLLIAACHNYWEKEHDTLASIPTQDLIKELYQSKSSLSEISCHLYDIVNRLNKREKYYPVAKTLIWKISKLYNPNVEPSKGTLTNLDHQEMTADNWLSDYPQFWEVVQQLEQDPNAERINKMLYALVQNTWINDPNVLSHYSMATLVKQVRYDYPTLERLMIHLLKILKGLNKQGVYTNVIQTIITTFSKLYNKGENLEPLQSFVPVSDRTSVYADQTNPFDVIFSQEKSQNPRKYHLNYNPYELKRTIMKNTNPLRFKTLLFYVTNPDYDITNARNHEILIKTFELDQLLMDLFQQFQTVEQLQFYLEKTAIHLASKNQQLFKLEEVSSWVKVILVSIKPFYQTT